MRAAPRLRRTGPRDDGPVRMASGREAGVSLVEVLIAVVLLTVAMLAVASFSTSSSRDLVRGASDARVWAAVHAKLDELTAAGHGALASGSDTVEGHALSWTVQGSDPKKVILVVEADATLPVPDSFVTYVSKP